jgi:hypothetical protein
LKLGLRSMIRTWEHEAILISTLRRRSVARRRL